METHDIRRLVESGWGEEVSTISPLVGEHDLNYELATTSGERSVLKVMHAGADRGRVEMQLAAMRHLARTAPEVPVPRLVPPVEGGLVEWRDPGGTERIAWRIEWMPGRLLSEVRPRTRTLLRDLGGMLARLDRALEAFEHPALRRPHPWDLAKAGEVLDRCGAIPDSGRRRIVEEMRDTWNEIASALAVLPAAVVHGDANDHNVLVAIPTETRPAERISGILDFGDMVESRRVCEVAIAGAYALMGEDDPVGTLGEVVAGYHAVFPLTDEELELVFPLVRARLGVSVVFSAERAVSRPGEAYLVVSEAPAWAALERLRTVPAAVATARIRHACGRPPTVVGAAVEEWLEAQAVSFEPLLGPDCDPSSFHPIDFGFGYGVLEADPATLECGPLAERVERELQRAGARVGIGLWNEARPIYRAPAFAVGDHPIDGARTVHMGVDVWVPAGTPLYAPVGGVVEEVAEQDAPGDYGPVLLLRHEPKGGPRFWTLWGHLDPEIHTRLRAGAALDAGDLVAHVGAPPRNGNWPPHLHLQVATHTLGRGADLPGVVLATEREAWRGLFPNPARLVGMAPDRIDAEKRGRVAGRDAESLARRRAAALGSNLGLSYDTPLHMVSGWRQFLFDPAGRAYLDLYNNVPHVGHAHPRVAAAVREQTGRLNTNTRYLHDNVVRLAETLLARFPGELDTAYFLNSASEANELALRIARAATGRRELVVMAGAYHGHTTTLIDASPYKFDGPGGEGATDWIEVLDLPDLYRGRHRREDPHAAARYVADARTVIEAMVVEGRRPGAFMAESLPSVGGQIVLPEGYLAGVYDAVRAVGGVCIADEVQVGFGRLGEVFWGFELQGVVPDVVVLGKPMGNGFPLAAVVTRRELAERFDNGMEFFSTFGGNPVACAAGLAVLEVLEEEGLQDRARIVGDHLTGVLLGLAARHPVLGDVRGMGLFQGVELVADPVERTPAPELASYLVDRLAGSGVLTGTDGPDHNVVKIRGPLVVDEADVDRFGEVMERILGESPFGS